MNEFHPSGKEKIACTDTGSGVTVVLIHGYLETREIWARFAEKLSSSFRVIAIDLPGHGGSEPLPENEIPSMESIADSVACLLKCKGLNRVFIVGHSLGGYITLAIAERHPDMLYGYCLLHSHPFPDSKTAFDNRENQIALIREGNRDQFIPESITKMYAASNTDNFTREIRDTINRTSLISDRVIISVLQAMMSRPSRQSVMESGTVPFVWILGAKDNFIVPSEALAKVRMPQNSEAVILENSGHMSFIEEEDRAVKLLTEFIRKVI